MKYKVEHYDEFFDSISDVLDYCIEYDYHDDDDDEFEEWVNDNYDHVSIAGRTYSPYEILREFGNTYDVLDDYQSDMNDRDRDIAEDELDNAEPGDTVECQRYTIRVCYDDDYETGDTDGDDASTKAIEATRKYYEEQKAIDKMNKKTQETVENDIMSLFQHIGD